MAVVGITDIGASTRQPPDEWRGMDTTKMAGLREYVQELRAREKPDLVVALTHTGLTIARNIARETPEFDVVLSGHTHERTAWPILEGKVLVVEPGAFSSWLGRLDLILKPGGGIAAHEFQLIPILANKFDEDPAIKKLVDASLTPHRDRMAREVGRTDTVLMRYDVLETSADDFVSDAVRTVTGADIGLTNGFRFGVPVASIITEGDLWNLLPMDARMKKGWVTDLLNQAPLRWMMKKAELHGLSFRSEVDLDGDAVTAPTTNSYGSFLSGYYAKVFPPLYRTIGREPDVRDDGSHININETIDASVFKRWRADPTYRGPSARKSIPPSCRLPFGPTIQLRKCRTSRLT